MLAGALSALMSSMKSLYASMDDSYAEAAGRYGFDCRGCEDNCCTQRFFHYTLAEHFYLHEGLRRADAALSAAILGRAREVTDKYRIEIQTGEILPLMCPVNFEGLCRLYEWRPMICRLHGLPHKFGAPDGSLRQSGGCLRFDALHKDAPVRLDRTPFYLRLAEIEKTLRADADFGGRYKKTTAGMLLEREIH